MRVISVIIAATAAVIGVNLSVAMPDLSVRQPVRAADGYEDVRRANRLGAEGKWQEGFSFIAELRSRPADKRNLEERQSVDMAEFALLRYDLDRNKERCIECLKGAYQQGPSSFWGYPAHLFLKELGVDVPKPPKVPLCGLGAWGDGVINLERKRLERDEGKGMREKGKGLRGKGNGKRVEGKGKRDEKRFTLALEYPADFSVDDLKSGSPVRRAILRKRLVEACTEEKIREILGLNGGMRLFSRLWDDDATLEDFLLSGPVFDAPLALETLMTLFLNDENEGWSKTETGRKATVAVAINAQKGDDMTATVRHWAAYRRIGMAERFLPDAAKRDCREWRFIVRRPEDPAQTLYLNAQGRFPTKLHGPVSKNIPYRKTNCFGANKFRKFRANMKPWEGYMRPWEDSGLPRLYLRSRIGGVCLEISRFSAFAANSQGLMAVTLNRPGRPPHLCWAMRDEKGDWQIYYKANRYSNKCFSIWGNGFQYLQSTERAFADRTAHDESELLLFAGRVKEAAMRCPYNYTAWRAYTDSLKAKDASVDEWRTYMGELLKLQKDGRLVTWDFAHEALDAMQKKGLKADELAKETAKVFLALPQPQKSVAEEMNYKGDALDRFLNRFKGDAAIEDKLFAVALEANKGRDVYTGQIFGCAMERFGKDEGRLERFFAAATSLGKMEEENGKREEERGKRVFNWRRIFASGVFQSDRNAFRMLANFRNENDPPTGTVKVPENDYGAPLVSGDALVKISSRGRGDTPEDHPRVSDATPYGPKRTRLFATKAENAPWATVELAGSVEVTGVTVIGNADDLVAWVSEDGEEWIKVGEKGNGKREGGWKLDLGRDSPSAKFVKIGMECGENKKPLSLKKILVYGNRQF